MKSIHYIFNSRPVGVPTADVFRKEEASIDELKENELLLKPVFISVDPYMRGRMNDTKSYAASWQPGQTAEGGAVARVIGSRSKTFLEGDMVTGMFPWATLFIQDEKKARKIDVSKFPPEYYLGVLGMPGLTAYFGMTDICRPQIGDTIVVSGAAGAVGLTAGQIAKISGARVIGIAGSDEKCRLLKDEFGFDETINYRTAKSIRKEIAALCPEGVNAYFDNVGGEITESVVANLAFHSRIALCGQISQYNITRMPAGSFMLSILLTRSVLLKGFIVRDYADRFNEGLTQLSDWLQQGKIKYTFTVLDGFDRLPEAFLGLFTGKNTGKMLVKVE
ncbi:MAG TPA: NADP-dependent oxidoreductase [Bacteroidales bacterium]|nr:NADP-dependent oxidoreductase [Bacteroidales bacterium]